MKHLVKLVDGYATTGHEDSMAKVKKYLQEELGFHDFALDKLQGLQLDEIANSIALHYNVDIAKINDDLDKVKQANAVTQIIKAVFRMFLLGMKRSKPLEEVLHFIQSFESALEEANIIHGGCLDNLMAEIPFVDLKDECRPQLLPQVNTNDRNNYLKWNGNDTEGLRLLTNLIHREYNIIKSPARFEKFLLGDAKTFIYVNRNKLGHFVYLVYCLLKKKLIARKGNKGHWALLSERAYDYKKKLIAENEKYFSGLLYEIRVRKKESNALIFNEIEDILSQIEPTKNRP